MIKLLVLDGYGVVFTGGYPPTMKVLAEKFNRKWEELHAIFYTKYFNMAAERKITQQQAWEYAIKETGLNISVKELKEIHYSFMNLNMDVVKLVEELKGKVKILLLSKNTRSQFNDVEKKMGFRKYFQNVINTWELGLPKASKETYEYIMRKFNVKPEEMLLVDDQENNLVEARKIGIHTLLFTKIKDIKEELR